MNTRSTVSALAALLVLAAAPVCAGPLVVAHKGVASEKVDASSLKAIFLGKKVSWDGAGRVVIATLKSGALAEEFYKDRLEMNASSFGNHWRRLAMTGGGIAPKSFESEADLLKFVAETPGAVGFASAANEQVATLAVP
jgi:hypothetical protein